MKQAKVKRTISITYKVILAISAMIASISHAINNRYYYRTEDAGAIRYDKWTENVYVLSHDRPGRGWIKIKGENED